LLKSAVPQTAIM